FSSQTFDQIDGLVARALSDEPGIFIEFVDESDQVNLYILFAQSLKELRLFVIAVAILAVSNHNQRSPTAIIVVTFLVFRNVLSSKIDPIDYCRLPAFHVEILQTINQ